MNKMAEGGKNYSTEIKSNFHLVIAAPRAEAEVVRLQAKTSRAIIN